MALAGRLATLADLPRLRTLVDAAIEENQKAFLDPAQIASSRLIMGVDAQLVEDGTYFAVDCDGELAGCGGWSRRATRYGGSHSPGRDATVLDPATDAARVRAMYTHPSFTRRGVGRLILTMCEQAAAAEGFRRLELVATLSGQPLYESAGFLVTSELVDDTGGAPVPLLVMSKPLG